MDFVKEKFTGLVVGNSSMSASVTPEGRLFGRIVYNPPFFECGSNGLREAGEGGFAFTTLGKEIRDCELDWNVTEHTYPFHKANATLADGLKLSLCTFAPIGTDDIETVFSPFIAVEYTIESSCDAERTVDVAFEWQTGEDAMRGSYGKGVTCSALCDGAFIAEKGKAFITAAGCTAASAEAVSEGRFRMCASYTVPAGGATKAVFLIGIFEDGHRFKLKFDTSSHVCRYAIANYDSFKAQTEDYVATLPSVGDAKIDEYLRWYTSAAIVLTKSAVTGEVMTMGYTELNQRDSYWTSFIHVSVWPELERDIMRVSKRWMRPDGKIPTTVLPRIEREVDIDINEYYCLRIARYFNYHGDVSFLREMYPSYIKSVDFLLTLDRDGDGVPEQADPSDSMSFWGDWKDVIYVQGRKLAPHFALLWLAVLKEGAAIARVMEDPETESRFNSLYAKAYETINRPVSEGGLWNGKCYVESWYNGRVCNEVLIDQTVGIFFGVVPEDRIESIYDSLIPNENEFGVRETFPYRTDDFQGIDLGGVYHNGGIWPYLVFCDAMGRYRTGHADRAEEIIKKIGHADLELEGDYTPGEFVDGNTGIGGGKPIQGWAAALYGSLTHGAFSVRHTGERSLEVTVAVKDRDFSTVLLLPDGYGRVTLTSKDGVLSCTEPCRKGYAISVKFA